MVGLSFNCFCAERDLDIVLGTLPGSLRWFLRLGPVDYITDNSQRFCVHFRNCVISVRYGVDAVQEAEGICVPGGEREKLGRYDLYINLGQSATDEPQLTEAPQAQSMGDLQRQSKDGCHCCACTCCNIKGETSEKLILTTSIQDFLHWVNIS